MDDREVRSVGSEHFRRVERGRWTARQRPACDGVHRDLHPSDRTRSRIHCAPPGVKRSVDASCNALVGLRRPQESPLLGGKVPRRVFASALVELRRREDGRRPGESLVGPGAERGGSIALVGRPTTTRGTHWAPRINTPDCPKPRPAIGHQQACAARTLVAEVHRMLRWSSDGMATSRERLRFGAACGARQVNREARLTAFDAP